MTSDESPESEIYVYRLLCNQHPVINQDIQQPTLLKLPLGGNQLLDLGKLVVKVEALRIGQSATGLDSRTRHDLFDGQLDLFHVDGCLSG